MNSHVDFNNRNIKSALMGTMDEDNRKRKPYREWLDDMIDIKEWCEKDIHLQIKIVQ